MRKQIRRSKGTTNMEQDAKHKIGEHIKRLREERKLSLRTLATKANINAGALSRIETGKRAPELDTVKAIATALGVPVTEMFAMGDCLNPYDLLPGTASSLNARYGHLSKEATTSIDNYLKRLIDEHGMDPNGPLGLEDEDDELTER
jgi:transcriptional regulator with XRE-family HTH domain